MTNLPHVIDLIVTRTQEINEEHAKTGDWDGPKLAALHAARLSLVIEALELGASADYLAEITRPRS